MGDGSEFTRSRGNFTTAVSAAPVTRVWVFLDLLYNGHPIMDSSGASDPRIRLSSIATLAHRAEGCEEEHLCGLLGVLDGHFGPARLSDHHQRLEP